MIKHLRLRALEKLAYRYHMKNRDRSQKENWKLAEKFLGKLDKRYKTGENNGNT